jgi:hypothetical protein
MFFFCDTWNIKTEWHLEKSGKIHGDFDVGESQPGLVMSD